MALLKRLVAGLEKLARSDRGFLASVEQRLTSLPWIRDRIEREYQKFFTNLEAQVKPYQKNFRSFSRIPAVGRDKAEIVREVAALVAAEEARWKAGYASGTVYHGGSEHIEFLNQVHALCSQSNPLHSDLFPSATKFEAEVVAMTAGLLGASQAHPEVCGTVSSGGTESILLAMKTYRDWARHQKGITRPEALVPVTAHAAFDKASQYLGIELIRIPVDAAYQADPQAARRAITRNTAVIVGSAPCFPHGVIDPIQELSELAREKRIGFHTDACLGGFVLPWAEKLGYPIPPFDFRLPGVTSISADTHKYGYAMKGTSVILYRSAELRRYQYYTATEWPGGLYFSPTLAGSRSGAVSAACWASLTALGERGYLDATRSILETASMIRAGIQALPDLYLLGDPLWVLAFASDTLDIYRIMDAMARHGWSLNGLQRPAAIHLCVTLRHTEPGVAQRFVQDLKASVEEVRRNPKAKGGMAPVYGMATRLPFRGLVGGLLQRYIDFLYEVTPSSDPDRAHVDTEFP